MKKKIYALLVGINNYPIPHHRLQGCENDVNAIRELLEGRVENAEVEMRVLLNEQATRQNIIDHFQNFLTQATADDIALFYYSGHGAQEPAPPEFWYLEPDHLNQSIVCYDSRLEGGMDLADKELSYLISRVAQKNPHFVVIMDCCHSGSGTRNSSPEVRTRQVETSSNYRPLNSFVGHESYIRTGSDIRVPKGNHLLLAAARSSQTAKETTFEGKQRGVFNFTLVDILQNSKGLISYADLMKRVNTRVMSKAMDQNPQIEAIFNTGESSMSDELNKAFLNGSVMGKENYFTITYKSDANTWIMDAGNVHGIPKVNATSPTVLALFKADAPETDLRDLSKAVGEADVTYTAPEYSRVTLSGADTSDTSKSFKAKIKRTGVAPIAFKLEGDDKGLDFVRHQVKELKSVYIALTDNDAEAKYRIVAANDTYTVKLIGDNRPLAQGVKGFNYVSASYVLNDMETIARWVQAINLTNPDTNFPANAVEIQMFRVTEIDNDDNPLSYEPMEMKSHMTLDYTWQNGEWKQPEFLVKIKNNTKRKLYCALLYMDAQFGIMNDPVPGKWLAEGEEIWAIDKVIFRSSVDDVLAKAGVMEVTDTLKLIYSTNEFNSALYNQDSLPLPQAEELMNTRKLEMKKRTSDSVDWATFELTLTTVRPQESVKLQSKQEVKLHGVKIKAPEGLNAGVSMTSLPQATRGGNNGLSIPAVPSEMRDQVNFDQVKFTEGRGADPGLSVLELTDVANPKLVTAEKPLEITLNMAIGEDEFIIPIGTDGEFYFPLGRTESRQGAETKVLIEQLPDATPAGTRSLGGSIKILFQKMVSTKLGREYTYPLLAKAEIDKDGEVQYMVDAAKIREQVSHPETKNIILFIHGIIGDTKDMTKAVKLGEKKIGDQTYTIGSKYDLVLTFDYENLHTKIEDTARDLKARLADIGLKEGHGKTLHIVAHSMGGLVSRWFIEREGGNKVVSHLIMLGTPNGGSPWANIQDWATMALTMVLSKISLAAWVVTPLVFLVNQVDKMARTLDQLNRDSDFLKNLNSSPDPNLPYTIISGNTSLIERMAGEVAKGTLSRMIQKVSSGDIKAKVFNDFIFGTFNDIAVSVPSIRADNYLKGRDPQPRSLDVACDHMSYFVKEGGVHALADVIFDLHEVKKTERNFVNN